MKTYFLIITLFLSPTVIFAGGTEAGSGESVIIRDNEVILADPFVIKKNIEPPTIGEPIELSQDLKNYLNHIKNLLSVYELESPEFWDKRVFGKNVQYRYTEDLPCDDPIEIDPNVRGEVKLVACTDSRITWIKRSLFERLNLKQQAVVLVHERLHGFTVEHHQDIMGFTSILLTLLTLQNNQFQGERRALNNEEYVQLSTLRPLGLKLGFQEPDYIIGNSSSKVIFQNGGGAVCDCGGTSVAFNAFVGVGSNILNSHIFGHTEIINSKIEDSNISLNNKIINSQIGNVQTGQAVTIKNSSIIHATIGDHTTIENSLVGMPWDQNLEVGVPSQNGDNQKTSIGTECKISNSTIVRGSLGNNSEVIHGSDLYNLKTGQYNYIEHSLIKRNPARHQVFDDSITMGDHNRVINSTIDVATAARNRRDQDMHFQMGSHIEMNQVAINSNLKVWLPVNPPNYKYGESIGHYGNYTGEALSNLQYEIKDNARLSNFTLHIASAHYYMPGISIPFTHLKLVFSQIRPNFIFEQQSVVEFSGTPPTFNVDVTGENSISNPNDLLKLKRVE